MASMVSFVSVVIKPSLSVEVALLQSRLLGCECGHSCVVLSKARATTATEEKLPQSKRFFGFFSELGK
jgi:hypothetical protein